MGRIFGSPLHRMLTLLASALFFVGASALFADDPSAAQQSGQAPSITLQQAVDQALTTGPGILISNAAVATARAQYTVSAAANGIGLSTTGSLAHSDRNAITSSISTPPSDTAQAGLKLTAPLSTSVSLAVNHTLDEATTPYQTSGVSLSASSTLWDGMAGGSDLAAVQQAALTLKETLAAEGANQKTIVYQVKQAYYTLLAQQRQLAILQQTLTQRQQELSKTQALYDAQSATQIDLKQAQINQKQAELDLALARDNVEVDREQLSALVGWDTEKVYSVAEVDDVSAPVLDAAAAVKTALAQRADLAQLQLKIASGDIAVALAQAKGSVQVTTSAGINLSQNWTLNNGNLGWNAGLQLAMPILDAGSTDAAVKIARLSSQSLAVQKQQLVATITASVKSTLYSLRDLLARADLAKSSLALAQSQYDLAQLQFDNGVDSNLDVLTASVALTTAQVNAAKARSDAQLGILALQDALGN